MKRKSLICIAVTAILMILLRLAVKTYPEVFSDIYTFPFEQIAYGLKRVAGKGNIGNAFALTLLALLSTIPGAIALGYGKEKVKMPERIVLYALPVVIFASIYGMINPSLIINDPEVPDYNYSGITLAFSLVIWGFVLLYFILRMIRLFGSCNKEQLIGYIRSILCIACVILAFGITNMIIDSVQEFMEPTRGVPDKIMTVFDMVVSVVPHILDIWVIMHIFNLLDVLTSEDRSEMVAVTTKLRNACFIALGTITGTIAVANVIRIIAARYVSFTNIFLLIPIYDIICVIIILAFVQLLIENKKLKDDNSMFI